MESIYRSLLYYMRPTGDYQRIVLRYTDPKAKSKKITAQVDEGELLKIKGIVIQPILQRYNIL